MRDREDLEYNSKFLIVHCLKLKYHGIRNREGKLIFLLDQNCVMLLDRIEVEGFGIIVQRNYQIWMLGINIR